MVFATEKHNPINSPAEYDKLSPHQKKILLLWIQQHIMPFKIKTPGGPSSYTIKHYFERSLRGFYITNGAMKGALKAAGFVPDDKYLKNWTYSLSKKTFYL